MSLDHVTLNYVIGQCKADVICRIVSPILVTGLLYDLHRIVSLDRNMIYCIVSRTYVIELWYDLLHCVMDIGS